VRSHRLSAIAGADHCVAGLFAHVFSPFRLVSW
jgi:hypothetical protein